MSITEAERNEIFEAFKSQHGERIASNLMSMLPPVGWADVATRSDLHNLEVALKSDINTLEVALKSDINALEVALKSDINALEAKLDRQIDRLDSKIDQQIDRLDSKIDQQIDRLDSKIDIMRFEFRAEMHQSIRNQTWALVAWTTGLAGLILALG